ncbi:fibronectin type III domain-containing protein [Candidatus Peregrinibacteria bacterium]|nr:fibronectin type III domain-containing protein [Candidatus Peregrinibacteria bacterium]
MKLNKLKTAVVSLIALSLIIPSAMADFLPVQVYATDTVAGYPASLRTSLIDPNKDVRFVVEKPDGGVVQLPAQADLEGIARTDFYGHQTKLAGTYKATVVYPGSATSSPQALFTVYPDTISISQSSLRSTLQMVDAGMEVTFLVATLYDQYRNPISDHHINLISSRSEDRIEILQNGVTDQNGRANFKVSSKYPGVSVFTAVDTTANMILEDREEVVFVAPAAPVTAQNPFAANLLAANIGGDGEVLPGPVDHFDIEGLPSTAKVGQELSLTVVARDKSNNVAKNYTGTILISVPDDENAILPNSGEYTFKASDQGRFTFDLSLIFSKLGRQAVQVLDKSNFKIVGEHQMEIVPLQAVVPGPYSSDLAIKSPTDGAELGTNLIILTGQGKENINLKVFDNDVKIGDTETDGDGFFSFEVKNLESGSHSFYVMSDAGEVSRGITIRIDTIPPVLNSFIIEPEGPVVPGDQLTITAQSEPNLQEAKIRLQGVLEPLEESVSEPGTYSATVVAPVNAGTFPVDVVLVDSLSNKAELLNKGSVTVASPQATVPPQVEGLTGVAGDTAVQLTWESVQNHDRPIQHYRVYYGLTFDALDLSADTQDATPQWELRGLSNNRQYFIGVKAVDTQGNESGEMSVVIAVTPIAPDPCAEVDCGAHGQCAEGVCECDEGYEGDSCETISQLIVPSGTQVTAVPMNGAVQLSWPAFAGVRGYYYKVFMGFAPGQYNDFVVTPDNRTSVTIGDLINNAPYYFAVAALDMNGDPVSELSREVQATPTGTAFRPSAPTVSQPGGFDQDIYRDQLNRVPGTDATGPEVIWVILASLVFAHFLYHHKRKIILKQNS